ncbi:MAG TPA: PAS domain S-box protein, partial [Coleofasciculaceae cyanobacterium]
MSDLFAGDGEVRHEMRSLDWSTTGFGTVDTWTASLRTAVSLCLNARLPIVIFWGSEFAVLHNDSLSELLGGQRLPSLGQPAQVGWAAMWDSLAPALQTVLATGQPAESALQIDRQDEASALSLTFFHTPIILETGICGGCFTTVSLGSDRFSNEPFCTSPELAVPSLQPAIERIAALAESDCESSDNCDLPIEVPVKDPMEIPVEDPMAIPVESPIAAELDHLAIERQRSEEMYSLLSAIVESSDDAIIGFTLNGRMMSWNCGAEKLFGYTAAEIQGQSVSILVPPDRDHESLHLFETMRQGGSITHFETVRLRKDGTPIDVAITASPIQTGDDELLGVSMTLRDMTASNHDKAVRQQAEIDLQRANERFEWAAMAVNCLIYDWDIVQNRMERTEGLTRLLGYSLAEAIPTAEWWRVLMHPEDVHRVDAEVATTLAIGDRYAVEYRIRNKNNQYIYVLDQGLVAARDADGKPIRQVGSVTDISERRQAEAALRDRETHLRLIVESAKDYAIITLDFENRITSWNSGAQRLLGYEEADIIGQQGSIIFTPEDNAQGSSIAEMQAALATGRGENERWHVRQDGSRFWGSGLMMPLRNEGGEIQGFLKIMQDKTLERRATEALHESEARYRTLSDAVAQLMWINSADGRIQYANSRWREYMGLQPSLQEEVNWSAVTHPDDIPALLESRSRGIATGEVYEIECRLKRYDQTYHWHLSRIVPLKDDQGQVLCWFGTATEIEAIKRIEVEQRFLAEVSSVLTASLDYTATLQSIVRLAVPFLADYCILDMITAEGQVQRVSWYHPHPERLDQIQAFVPPLSLQQHPVIQALLTGKASLLADLTLDELRSLAVSSEHLALVQTLGSQSWMVVPLITHQRTLGALTFCFTSESNRHHTAADLTLAQELAHRAALALDNAQLYQQAQEANRIKDEFLAILSHELRTPLNPILGWSRLLKTGKLDAAKTARALDTIERNAQLQADLIEDLLDISRILQGKLLLNMTPVDLKQIITSAQETVRLAAEAKAIAIHLQLAPVEQIAGDAGRLQQVVWNLLSNAIKFTPEQGQVTVRLQKVEAFAQIQIIDTGKGILPEFLPYVFDYFRQADSATTRKFGGLGLGLAIVRHIVELHGGSVFVDSAGEG